MPPRPRQRKTRRRGIITHPWPITKSPGGKDFVDFDEDLRARDIVNSVHDGFDDIQLVKRYSTAGLGPSQGRHANLNTIRMVARATGRDIQEASARRRSGRRWCPRSSAILPAAA